MTFAGVQPKAETANIHVVCPIGFYSAAFKGATLNCTVLAKEATALVKVVQSNGAVLAPDF